VSLNYFSFSFILQFCSSINREREEREKREEKKRREREKKRERDSKQEKEN
jgi:hypothetical protein